MMSTSWVKRSPGVCMGALSGGRVEWSVWEHCNESAMSEPEQTVSFIGFVISIAHTAAVHFGDVAVPGEEAPAPPDLPAAQQMIDILALLEQKTKGNLTAEERQVLEQVLYELRLRYVQAQKDEQDRPRIIHP